MLLCIFQNAPAAVVKAVFDTCFVSTVQIVLESDDHGEMQVHAKTRFICVRHNLLPPFFLLADQDKDMVVDQIISWLVKSLVL
jgi:hypothetical protein